MSPCLRCTGMGWKLAHGNSQPDVGMQLRLWGRLWVRLASSARDSHFMQRTRQGRLPGLFGFVPPRQTGFLHGRRRVRNPVSNMLQAGQMRMSLIPKSLCCLIADSPFTTRCKKGLSRHFVPRNDGMRNFLRVCPSWPALCFMMLSALIVFITTRKGVCP